MADKKLEITQVRSGIGRPEPHRRTLRALGIKRHQQSVVHDDSPAIRGMIRKVSHLISVREIEG
jgi:large subunit ribosomal protein L30